MKYGLRDGHRDPTTTLSSILLTTQVSLAYVVHFSHTFMALEESNCMCVYSISPFSLLNMGPTMATAGSSDVTQNYNVSTDFSGTAVG